MPVPDFTFGMERYIPLCNSAHPSGLRRRRCSAIFYYPHTPWLSQHVTL